MDSVTGCPEDYEELFREYFPMMVGVVAKAGIEPFDVQDVAMDILARFIEKDGLSYYDPERLHDVGESPEVPGARFRKAKFKGMLRGFTAKYVLQYRDKQEVRHRRIPKRLEKPVNERGESWYEVTYGRVTVDPCGDSEVSISILQALKRAADALTSTKATRKRDYNQFVALCIEYGYLDGSLDRRRVAAEMGISFSTMTSMLTDLREVLRPLLNEVGVVTVAA